MSLSHAKRKRRKLAREGNANPEKYRLGWNGIHPLTKITPTIQEKQNKLNAKHKGKWNPSYDQDGGSIFQIASLIPSEA